MVWCCDYCGRELDGVGIDTPYGHFCCQRCANNAEIDELQSDSHNPYGDEAEYEFWASQDLGGEYDEYMDDEGWWDSGADDEY